MRVINYQKDRRQNMDRRRSGQSKNTSRLRLQTCGSEMTKTFQTQESFGYLFDRNNQYVSPSHLSISQTFNARSQEVIDLELQSQIEVKGCKIDEREVRCFLDEMKMMTFIAQQNRRQQLFIQKKMGLIYSLRREIEQLQEKIKRNKRFFQKKKSHFMVKKNSNSQTNRTRSKIIDRDMKQLSYQIEKMKFKIRQKKMKTQSARPMEQRPYIGQNRYRRGTKLKNMPFVGNFYPQIIYQPVPQMYNPQQFRAQGFQYQQNVIPPPYNTDRLLQQYVQVNCQKSSEGRIRTEATQQMRTYRDYQLESHLQQLLHLSKSKQNSKNGKESARSMRKKSNNNIVVQNDRQCEIKNLKYFESSEDGSIPNKYQKQNYLKSENIEDFEQSQCQRWNHDKSDEEIVDLLSESEKNKNRLQQINYLKIDKNIQHERQSSCGQRKSRSDKFSNSGVYIMTSSDQKRRQSESQRSQNQELYRRKSIKTKQQLNMLESPIVLQMSDVRSSINVSKRSSFPKEEVNRYMPLLNKQCMLIEEESEEMNSLKVTPNDRVTPRNNSRNERLSTPNNSQNSKTDRIVQVEEEQLKSVSLKQPPKLEIGDGVDVQLSKIKLNTQSKISRGLMSPKRVQLKNDKQDDDILGSICLVGQSKISRMKSSTQKRSTIKLVDEMDESKYMQTNSEINKEGVGLVNESDDFFDFSLSQESNIVKRNGKMNRGDRMSGEFVSMKNDGSDNNSRFSLGSRQFVSVPIEEDEGQNEDYPSNKAKGKTVPL